jgi:nucleoside-diphosphate-sugar epimerase
LRNPYNRQWACGVLCRSLLSYGRSWGLRLDDNVNLVTGAAGLLGSHIAEHLTARGARVRALVRPSSDLTFLRSLGAELVEGDLRDVSSLRRAAAGASTVYHCASKVGEWGPWTEYQEQIIDATRNLLEACRTQAISRVLHVSSITVYGHLKLRDGLYAEDEPLGQNLWFRDYYIRAKIAAEELARIRAAEGLRQTLEWYRESEAALAGCPA